MIVVSSAARSKGIRGAHLLAEGESIHDCHAENLTRCGSKYFIFDQVAKYQPDPIFQQTENSNSQHPPYWEVKLGIEFLMMLRKIAAQ